MMTRPGFRLPLLLLLLGGSGLVLSGSAAQFVVLRQALVASESSAASDSSALSADGRFVAFVSRARLSPTETRGIENIYVFDRVAGAIDLETVTADGAAADDEEPPPDAQRRRPLSGVRRVLTRPTCWRHLTRTRAAISFCAIGAAARCAE